ncbi:MAG: SagB/ThcOx family dehydrogenase [Bacteroidota bacterium]
MKKALFLFVLAICSLQIMAQNEFATITQKLENPELIKSKEFRYSGFVKMNGKNKATGHLWFRVDKPKGDYGFFDNMGKNPIKTEKWEKFEIKGTIDSEVENIYFGCFIVGKGSLSVDNIKLETKNEKGEWIETPIINGNFENVADSTAIGWQSMAEGFNYICDNTNPYDGKYSMKIEYIFEKEAPSIKEYLTNGKTIKLPTPITNSQISVEKAMSLRRSIREYTKDSLTIPEISQMLWAAWGVTDSTMYKGHYLRTTPSAGALFPFEVYIVVGKVIDLESGVYKYNPIKNSITQVIKGDIRSELCAASYSQDFIKKAPASILWTAVFERNTSKYGKRGRERYVCMDLGHSGQNVYLQAETLGLGTCAVAAFSDADIVKLFKLPKIEEPLYIMPFGKLTKFDIDRRAKL